MLGARPWSNDEGGSAGVGVKQVCAYVCVKSPSVELPSEGVEGERRGMEVVEGMKGRR